MVSALSQCLELFEQREASLKTELIDKEEQIRVLTDGLTQLATRSDKLEETLKQYKSTMAPPDGDDAVPPGAASGRPSAASSRSSSRRTSMVCVSDSTDEFFELDEDDYTASYRSFDSDEGNNDDFEEVLAELDLDKTPTDECDFDPDVTSLKAVDDNAAAAPVIGAASDVDSAQSTPKAQRKSEMLSVVVRNDELRSVVNGRADAALDAELKQFDLGEDVFFASVESDGEMEKSCVSTSTTRSELFHDAIDDDFESSDEREVRDDGRDGENAGVNGDGDVHENGIACANGDANGVSGTASISVAQTSNCDIRRQSSVDSLPNDRAATPSLYPMFGRECLPATMVPRSTFSVWSALKRFIGRDLSKVTMPVVFNEPLSMLQRIAENMEYAILLDKAAAAKTALARMQYVAAFAASTNASNHERLGKPFNPLLGETYELRRDAYCFVAEQVIKRRLCCERGIDDARLKKLGFPINIAFLLSIFCQRQNEILWLTII